MGVTDRKYVRFYYPEFMRDYPTIWRDPIAFHAWMRLLVVAESMWPAPAELPRGIRPAGLRALAECGLVVVDGDTFMVKGHAEERAKRAAHARKAATDRWDAVSNAPGNAPSTAQIMPSKSISKDEHETSKDDGREDLEAFLIVRRKAPSPKQRQVLNDVLQRHDLTGPAWAADVIYRNPDDPIGAVLKADEEWRAKRIADAQAAERPKPQPRRPRGIPTSTRELMDEWKKTMPKPETAA